MTYIAMNLVPLLVATCAGLGVGALYAGLSRGFAGRGLAGGREPGSRHAALGLGMGFLLLAAVAEFWLAAILAGALILAPSGAGAWTMSLGSAFIIWIGFVVPVLAVTHPFRGLRARVALLDCAHWLAVMAAQAAALQAMGLAKP